MSAAKQADLGVLLEQRHLPALDGLRAIAVFTVMVYHFGVDAVPGDLGVSGFFVLSGFLITWLLRQEYRASGTVSLKNFYLRRTLRIFPAYYVFVVFSLVVDRIRGTHWPPALTASAFGYVMNYYNALHGYPITSVAHAWSLAIEEQFYLLWPLAFLLLSRGGPRTLRRALGVVIVAVVLWRSYLYLVRDVGSAYVYDAFDTRFDNLAVGCLLALGLEEPGVRAVASQAARWSWLPLVTLALLIISRQATSAQYHYSAGFTVDAMLVAVFIVQMLQLSGTRAWSWLELPVVRYLGRISYPLYLYHLWGDNVGDRARALGPVGMFAVATLASIALASGSYFVVERPFLSLKRAFESRRVSSRS